MSISQSPNQRKINRLSQYDYSKNGYYFVTICTRNKTKYFGQIVNGEMHLNRYGTIAENVWIQIPQHYDGVALDEFVIMPNHIHGIIAISTDRIESQDVRTAHYGSLSNIIGAYKSLCTKKFRKFDADADSIWLRSFYDHVVRNDESLHEIREYIRLNPLKWDLDEHNPAGSPQS
ncbi:MAG: transposase [Candidatus Auribacterota bacterium]